jgi:hypothetical protein
VFEVEVASCICAGVLPVFCPSSILCPDVSVGVCGVDVGLDVGLDVYLDVDVGVDVKMSLMIVWMGLPYLILISG